MLRTQDLLKRQVFADPSGLPASKVVILPIHFLNSNDHNSTIKMPGISLANTIAELSLEDEWGPEVTTSTTLDGVPYAPYSKGDKLGRMADWTQEGKEGRDRGQRYGRGYRGKSISGQCMQL